MAGRLGSYDVMSPLNPTEEQTNISSNPTREEGDTEEKEHQAKEAVKDAKDTDQKDSSSESSSVRLKKELGFMEGVGVIIGCVIGSGIFVSPKGVLQYSGSVGMSLMVWAASGVLSMLGALSFTELGTMIPESGGMYSYIHRAFGPVPAFLYMWVTNLTRSSAGTAVIAITFAQYLLQLVIPNCEDVPVLAARVLAAALICFLTWVNCVNVRWVTKMQNVFTVTKVGALLVIILAGLWELAQGRVGHYASPWTGTRWEMAAIATAFYQSLFSYTGWDYLNLVTEELKNPNRNLPLAVIVSTTMVTVVYTLANVAYFAVLTPAEMLSSEAVVMTFGARVLGILAFSMPVFVMLSTFGSTHASVFTQSRLIFVGARRGHFPGALGLVSTTNYTPVPAVIFSGLTILAMLLVPDVSHLINYTAFSATAMQFACVLALFWFRYKHPEWPRPFKVWLAVPLLFAGVQIFLLTVPLVLAPLEVAGAVGVILAGLPVYYIAIYRQDLARLFSSSLDNLTLLCQKLFLCVPEEKAE